MVERPLHAVVLPVTEAGGRLLELLAGALDGTGPAILPLDPDLPPERLAAILDTFAPAAVHTADGVARRPGAQPAGPDTAVVIATSGSTGQPKGVELSAAALRHSARATLDRAGATPGQRWLLCLPATHIAGIQVLVRSLVAGTDPVIAARADAGLLAASGCAHVSIVPTQLRRLLDADPDAAWARGFTSVLLGGAAAPAALVEAARAAGVPVLTTYGMSETCGGCVYDGRPLTGVTVATGDAGVDGGRIRITGPVLFSGYRGRPDLTAAAMDGAWFVTSDLGTLGADGRLAVRGRADDVIITGGEKVVAGEVASLLETCPGVREAVVVGRPDPEWGERVTAVIVPDNPARPPTLDLLCRHVRERLPRYALPRELVLRAALPMLPSGKPDLETLRREQSPAGNVSR
ncbi:MAG TPA: AMP-binding protein [Streptosporangiaceae bacterium]